jgi:hypothetical protein
MTDELIFCLRGFDRVTTNEAADLIEAQAKKITELQKDAERLDYLESISTYKGNFMYSVHHLEFTQEFDGPCSNFRAAIDEAMKGQK